MNNPIDFFVPGKPVSKGNIRSFQVKGRTVYVDGNKSLKSWEALARMIIREVMPKKPWDGAIEVEATFYFQEPKGTPKCRKGKLAMTKKPDIEKIARALNDAMTGLIYVDDSQITCLRLKKRYDDAPGVHVFVWHGEGERE